MTHEEKLILTNDLQVIRDRKIKGIREVLHYEDVTMRYETFLDLDHAINALENYVDEVLKAVRDNRVVESVDD